MNKLGVNRDHDTNGAGKELSRTSVLPDSTASRKKVRQRSNGITLIGVKTDSWRDLF